MPVFSSESAGNGSQWDKSEPFIKMPRVDVAFHDRIELQYSEAQTPAGFHAMLHQLFADMLTA